MKKKNQYIVLILFLALLMITLVLWYYNKRLQEIEDKNPVKTVLMKRNLKRI